MSEPLVGRLERDGDTDTLLVGPPPLIPVQLILRGDTVAVVDPSAPSPSIRMVIGDPVAATPAVQTVLGEAALDALWGNDPTAEFVVPVGTGLAALQRLALLTWLRWDSPLNLDPVLLEMERAVALWDLNLALDADGVKEAEAMGDHRWMHRMIIQAEIVAVLENPANKLLRPTVLSMIDGFLRENAGDPGQRDVLRQRRDTIREAVSLHDRFDFDLEFLLLAASVVESVEPADMADLAGLMGTEDRAGDVPGAGFVDQMQIPRWLHGVLNTTDDAVRWTIHPNGSVDVTVDQHPEGPIDAGTKPFSARLVNAAGQVLASAPLAESEDGQAFVGRLQPSRTVGNPAELWVDVFVDETTRPAHGPTLSLRHAQLRAGWAFALDRRQQVLEQLVDGTDSPLPDPDPRIGELWDVASNQFAAAGSELSDLAEDRRSGFESNPRPAPVGIGLGPTLAEIAFVVPV